MPGPSPSTSTVVNQTQIPQWISDAGQANYDKAVSLDNSPLQQFAGPTVAAPSAATTNAFNYFDSNLGAGSGDTAKASQVFQNLSDPTKFSAGVQGYLNPYISNVVQGTIGAANDQLTQSLQNNADRAIASKAFGGTRSAVTDAVTRAQTNKDLSNTVSGLLASGYNTAASQYTTGQATAGQGLLSTGDQENSQVLKNFAGLQSIGQQTDATNQKVIDSNVAKFNEQRDKELNDLNVRLSSLGMTPYAQSNTSTTTSNPGSPGVDYGALGLGALSLLSSFLP